MIEEYEIVEFTTIDRFWYEIYNPFRELVSISVEATLFLLNQSCQ